MKTIFKYEVPLLDMFSLELHEGYRILCVQEQKGTPCIWVLTDTQAPKVTAEFYLVGTGHKILETHQADTYIGSFQLHGGNLVLHLFHHENQS